jgi:methionyl-tRNA formyltransferase
VLAEFDLVVVLAYGELLRRPMLEAPRFGCVNLHGSLLPRWRGASPLQAVIRAGDSETGISVMRMVRALDAGPVWSRYPLPLGDRPTLPCLHDAMADLAAEALGDFLRSRSYEQEPEPQDESAVTMCGKLTTADGRADFSASAEALDRQVRAYTPAPGCWAEDEAGTRIRLQSVDPRPGGDLAPGIVAVNGKEILVGCGEGHCALQRLQPAGAKSLDAVAFLNGRAAPQRLV